MNAIHGFVLTVIGGLSTGFNMLPLKWERVWKWENFWLVYTIVSLLIVPPILAYELCPGLWGAYSSVPSSELWRPFVLGVLWGLAQLGAGLGSHRLGFAMTGSILGGVGTAVGALVPLVMQHSGMVFQTSGLLIFAGTAITLAGVSFCGWAGYHREQLTREQGRRAGFSPRESGMSQADPTRKGYILMLVVVVVSGVLSADTNIALAYAGDLLAKVQAAGAAPQWATFAVWPLVFLGGSISNLVYTFVLLTRNKTWGNFGGGPREVVNPALGACMWMGGIALYGSATTYLGKLGPSIGFALFTLMLILCGQFAAVFTGEWRQIETRIISKFVVGLVLLFAAVGAFATANYYSR
jgi:L-rhamnose-H+ transport protein